jgi:hypothetical protein
MEEPQGPEAYIPTAPPAGIEDEWPPATREIALEQAREMRLEEDGLPVDDATLERVVHDVMNHPDWPLPGAFLTAEELADDELLEEDEEYFRRIKDYLRRYPDIDGSIWMGWRDGHRIVYVGLVGDAESHKAALSQLGGDRLAFVRVPRPVHDLEALQSRISDDVRRLDAEGFRVLSSMPDPQRGVVRVDLVGHAVAAAQQHLAARYGDAVAVEWHGPSLWREVSHPFGSWTSEGRLLRLCFGLERGGRPGSARVTDETSERIVIALSCLQQHDVSFGGFKRHHADLELREPVGDRAVIDASAGVPRPPLAQLRS